MMKKNLFILAVAAAALASCSSDEVVSKNTSLTGNDIQQKEIAFSPLSRPSTRLAGAAEYNAVETNDYPQNYDMKVVAYSIPVTGTAGNYFGSSTANAAPLFSYQFAGGSSAPGTNASYWGGYPPQYWPLSPATLNFLAVSNNGSPTADMVSETFQSNYASGVDVTLGDNKPQAATTGTGQHDLMYGFGTASVTQSGNTLIFPPKADLTFSHALAWVVFRVKAGNASSEAISIKDIKLKGAHYGGSFQARLDNYNVTSPALAWNTSNTKWTAADRNGDYYSPNFSSSYDKDGDGAGGNDSKSIEDDSWTQIGDGLLVVPTSELSPAEESMTSFDIEYYLNGNLYTYNYAPADKTYEKGKKYIYDITMTLHEIFVNPSVESWQDGGTEFVDIPSFVAPTGGEYPVDASARVYTCYVTGLGSGDVISISETTAGDIIEDATLTAVNTSGTVKITFTMKKNTGSARTANLTLTDTTDGTKTTVITINQAAGA